MYQKANRSDYTGCIHSPWECISACKAPGALCRAAGPRICKETESYAILRDLSFKILNCFDGKQDEKWRSLLLVISLKQKNTPNSQVNLDLRLNVVAYSSFQWKYLRSGGPEENMSWSFLKVRTYWKEKYFVSSPKQPREGPGCLAWAWPCLESESWTSLSHQYRNGKKSISFFKQTSECYFIGFPLCERIGNSSWEAQRAQKYMDLCDHKSIINMQTFSPCETI